MSTGSQVDHAKLVKQAEDAVRSVKDAELRRVAFEKILDSLLAGRESSFKVTQKNNLSSKNRTAGKKSPRQLSGPKAYIRELVDDDFFKKPKTISQVKTELENRGHHVPMTSLSGPLQSLCKDRILRRQRTKQQTTQKGKKNNTFTYTNW